jgi:queuine tRNA-ribosyltransferase/7-cyano-7-deazaguanine tRNA-ribosyltransferase
MEFKILKKSKKSRARLGIIKTAHGEIETPAFIGVATQATLKTLDSKESLKTETQALICNTFHLHLKPTEDIVAKNGGLHKFMDWNRPLMTDSGGYQVFSLGFGRDFGTGKILKEDHHPQITPGQQPQNIKITNDGVWFRSPIDGQKLFIGPKESIKIQQKLGADIIFAFDECPSPLADKEYNKKAIERTHAWAKICLQTKKTKQALYGIIQGGRYKDLRIESAKFINSLDFDGFGIGGEFGKNKTEMKKMLSWVIKELVENKPRHLLGIGDLKDIPIIIKEGIDTFDCTIPTHYARHGYAFTSQGKIDMQKSTLLKDTSPLDKKCQCYVCKTYTKSYICHLFKAREITALKLITFHNLFYFNNFVKNIRNEIKKGKI